MANFKNPNDLDYNDQMKDFEKSRIRTLQLERINVQKKTFTKWCNSFLSKIGMEVDDLFKDLQDGRRLIKLLELISGEKLGKPNQGKLKVHKIENVNRSLIFIQSKTKLESIGAEDIVAGNPTLILGLIWTIILRFQIQDIEIEVENESKDKRSAKEALLLWCQRKTTGYPNVRVNDFTVSWRNGLAFNALVHSQRPDLFDYNALNPHEHRENLNHAFDMAQKHLGISKLLDAEDIDVDKPDEKSVLTYVSSYFHTFAKLKNESLGGKRVGKIIGFLVDIEKMIENYENQVIDMQQWISQKIKKHRDFVFPNSLDSIKSLMLVFNKEYRILEKEPKFKQKSALAAHFYNINMQLTAQKQPKYQPPEGRTLHDLEAAWSSLEKAEHERELALKKELNRQEQLEQLYAKFDKKAKLREDWLSEMANILSNSLVSDTSQIDATFKKQEAIGTDMHERADLFSHLDQIAKNLIKEDYFFKETVRKRNQQIQNTYNNLLEQFEKRKQTLSTFQELESLFKEMERLKNEMLELETSFQSKDYGEYLLAIEELLTKHTLLESQKSVINQHLKSINRRAQQFTRSIAQSNANSTQTNIDSTANPLVINESQLVKEKLDALNKAFELINVLGAERRKYLEDHRLLHKFIEEADEEWMWVQEKLQIVKSTETGHNLSSTQILINKHEQLEDELKFRKPRIDDKIIVVGEHLISSKLFNQPENDKIHLKCSNLLSAFDALKKEAGNRRSILEDSFTSQQYFADANEAESWMNDKMALVSLNSDCGKDEASAQALLHRHVRIQEEIKTYEPEIRRLDEITNVLVGKRRFSSFPIDMRQKLMKNKQNLAESEADDFDEDEDESDLTYNDETDLDSRQDDSALDNSMNEDRIEFVDQVIEKEVTEVYIQEVRGYAVRALYPYESKTFNMVRGEVLELKEKSNEEWWLVEGTSGREGFAPANYLKELGNQRIPKQRTRIVKQPEHVKVKKLVKRTNTQKGAVQAATALAAATVLLINQKNQATSSKKNRVNKLRRKTTSIQPRMLQHLSTEELQKRQVEINYLYSNLFTSSIEKRKQLDNSINFYKWIRKYDELDRWIKEKKQSLSIDKENSLLDHPDAAKRRYQAFNSDFIANQSEYVEVKALAEQLSNTKTNFKASEQNLAMSNADVGKKQAELNHEWAQLLELKKYWDNAVKAIQCIDQFNLLYADVNDLLNEKLSASVKDDVNSDMNDVKSVRALQSKQDKLERDIGPIEANVSELKKTADQVCKYFPQEKDNVQKKLGLIDDLWSKLRDDVKNRKAKLDEKHGLQRFENEVQDFEEMCSKIANHLNELENPLDLKQCEDMQKKYENMEQEFNNELSFKFNDLKQLSQKQLAKRGVIGNVKMINSQLNQVASQRGELAKILDEKGKYLEDFHKYLKFKQDANNFELIMVGQEAYLQYEDLGSSSEDADALLKRHDEFLAKLNAQDEKMKILTDQYIKLNNTGPTKHFAIPEMDQILNELSEKRQKLKAIASERKQKLKKSKEFFEFKNQCDDLNAWINERRRQAQATYNAADQIKSAENFYLIEKYLNKHEALEKELNANRTRLEKLKSTAANLDNKSTNANSELVKSVEENWNNLEKEVKTKGKNLQETKYKADLSASLSDVDSRMKNLEDTLNTKYNTGDLRSVKEALKKHNDLQKQLTVEVDLLGDLSKHDVKLSGNRAMPMNAQQLNNRRATENAVKEYMNKFKLLNPIIAQKQKYLETDLVVQQLIFDMNEELKWIDQSKKQIAYMSSPLPNSLFEAQNVCKKQAELERSVLNKHKPTIEKICLQSNDILKNEVLSESNDLDSKTKQLETAWDELLKLNEAKRIILNECLTEQEALDELNQIYQNITEKLPLIESTNADAISGKEDSVLSKHLVKLEQLEHDLKGYEDVLNTQLEKNYENPKIERKLQETRQQLDEMIQLIAERKKMLKLQQEALEFDREASELMQWINQKRAQAQSEDYGEDFEHLALINAKFQALKDEVRSCEEPRYASVRKLSTNLLNAKSPEAKSIRKKIDDIKTARELLDDDMHNRELTLSSAAEIHCFNKDVQDLLRRIDDKEITFADVENSVGRDLHSCESLLRKHKIYIEELTALKVQLHDLNKQSDVLREKHPGDTAESVAAETDELIDRFKALWRKTEKRTHDLKQSSDYFKFLICVKDVGDWIERTSDLIREQPQNLDLFTVTQLKEDHQNLSFEMTQRDDIFKDLEKMCIMLTTKQNHPNKREIMNQTNQAMTNREYLFRLWKTKSDLLDSQHELQLFYREVSQLVAVLTSQENILAKSYNESSQQIDQGICLRVEDLEELIKKHENLEKKIEKQSVDKTDELSRNGADLLAKEKERSVLDDQAEFKINETYNLQQKLANMIKKQGDVKHICDKRSSQLKDILKFSELRRDIDEFELWIDERIRFARNLNLSNHSSSPAAAVLLNDKVKLFQKQKALGTEIETNANRFFDLIQRCEGQLNTNKTVNKSQCEQINDDLTLKWKELCDEFKLRADEFEEAKDVLEFNDQLGQVEEWLKEKELMLQNGDTGRDYEHCILLCKRADEAISPANEDKLKQVIQMGDKLVKLGRTDRDLVLEKKDRLLNRYRFVKESVNDYKARLSFALEIHSFNRDYDDLQARISEKILLLSSDLDLRTLDSVQVAQSKVVELESDLKAIRHKLDTLNADAIKFMSQFDQDEEVDNLNCFNDLKAKIGKTEEGLSNLDQSLQIRKKKLDSALCYQKFMVEYRDLKSWILDVFNRINQQPEPVNLSEAETALNLHQERRTEIDGKGHRFVSFQNMGHELNERNRNAEESLANAETSQKEISKLMKELVDAQYELKLKCDEKQKFLQECNQYQDLRESWKQLESWSKNIENSLRSIDTGDSVLSVKSLLTKHDHIENSVKLQIGSLAAFDSIEQRGQEMIRQNYNQSAVIQNLINDCAKKRKELDMLCASRRKILEDSLMFQNFLLNYYEAQQWIKEKTASALDKTYLDLTNLLTKIQRHQTFMSDLKKSGVKRVEDVHNEAEALIARHQTTALSLGPDSQRIVAEIRQYIKDLNDQWNALKVAAESKKKCLEDSHKCVLFTRLCNDMMGWCDEVEAQLGSDDNGHDLSSCKMLLLRHEALTRQIRSQEEKIKEVDNVIENSHENFMFNKMKESADAVKQNYLDLQDPCVIRNENLEESLSFFTIIHDLDDSLQFISEKQVFVMSEELGSNLDEAKKLQKKHSQIEQEVNAHQPLLMNSVKQTRQLIERKHYAHAQLSVKLAELEEKWASFKDLIEKRGQILSDSLEVQKFYSDAEDLMEWLKEKQPKLSSTDYGKDDLASISYLKKLEILLNEINTNQRAKLDEIGQCAKYLQARDIYDKKNIARKQTELEQYLESLIELGKERQQYIKTMLKVFEFERECEADINWFKDQQVIASSQDFGTDLEHAESLLNKFNEFINDLDKNSDRIQRIDEMAQQLCENEYTPSFHIDRIDERCSILNEMWKDLNTLAEVRRQTLEGAIEVHAFDKDCDDLITWAVEKESFLKQEDIGYDLASVFTLAKQQDSLENELTALSEELERLNSESRRLCTQYPETKEHIETRLDDADTTYNELLKQLQIRKEKIQQSQSSFLLTNEFNELSEWLRDIQTKITSTDLSTGQTDSIGEVSNAEMLIKKHREYKVEIDLQQPKIKKFISKSDDLNRTERKAFNSKIDAIKASNKNLLDTWQSRQELYEQNLEYNKLLREIKLLDTWLSSKDSFVHTDLLGENVQSVEALLKQHDDFEGMLRAMEQRFEELKKENKLEKTLRDIKQRELENKEQQEKNFAQEKQKEVERKKKMEKRRQNDRRRTQEIISIVTAPNTALSTQIVTQTVNVPIEIIETEKKGASTFTKNIEATSFAPESTEEKPKSFEQIIPIVITNTATNTTTAIKSRKDRNRTRSIRDRYKLPIRLPAPTVRDYVMRKQEFQKGGQRAPIREYQQFFTTIHANLMCFFASEKDYNELNAANQPINLYNCKLNKLEDATIRRDVLHIETADGADYLIDVAGEDYNEEMLDTWFDKVNEASNTQPLPMFSVASTGDQQSPQLIDGQENILTRPPRSRQPVVITNSRNPVDEVANSYVYANKTYAAAPNEKPSDRRDQEVFAQDSTGVINGSSNNDLSVDTTDIAPYRYKNETPQPNSHLSPNGAGFINQSTKIGEKIRQSATVQRKPQLSPKTATVEYITPEYQTLRTNNTILEESFKSASSTFSDGKNKNASQQQSYYNQSTRQNIIYSQSSSKTIEEIVKDESRLNNNTRQKPLYENSNQYPIVTSPEPTNNVANSLLSTVKPSYPEIELNYNPHHQENYIVEEVDDNYNEQSANMSTDNTNGDEHGRYSMKNLIVSPDSRNASLSMNPISPSTDSMNSEASSSTTTKSEKPEKHKRNIFGSLFKTKKKDEKSSSSSKKSSKNKKTDN